MTASRISHSTSSNGWTLSFVKCRLKDSPLRFTETSRSFVAMTPPVLARWEGLHRCDSGAYYTPATQPCQASFSQDVVLPGTEFGAATTTSCGSRNLVCPHP